MSLLEEKLEECVGKTEGFLARLFTTEDKDLLTLYASMRYSALAGGKRIRPFLVLSVAEMLGGAPEKAIYLAAALEMVHTYSLIHDDLPSMDNDDFRRGKLTNHKVYGEAVATLAGDALLTGAFELIAASGLSDRGVRRAVLTLAGAAGADGMVGGQVMDLAAEKKPADFETLIKTHSLKTGALMRASVMLGMIAAENEDTQTEEALISYAQYTGLVFQIVDDVLDVTGNAADLGKSTGKDKEEGKTTFLSFFTPEEAMEYAKRMNAAAKTALAPLPGSELLCLLADKLLTRQK